MLFCVCFFYSFYFSTTLNNRNQITHSYRCIIFVWLCNNKWVFDIAMCIPACDFLSGRPIKRFHLKSTALKVFLYSCAGNAELLIQTNRKWSATNEKSVIKNRKSEEREGEKKTEGKRRFLVFIMITDKIHTEFVY